ncbi:hypothetical protein BAE44_0026364 [Dichanthelium oligosanthes]|uniref:RNase H type-1 domain-containing protein n=1 Tax=Dichanthelium oligosanthes TaxID=888268 RepID=A0A1E5UIC1_9POAL|nr:hypothetical protein BAE44_0026364 [Dichanthelium oligosanthes]
MLNIRHGGTEGDKGKAPMATEWKLKKSVEKRNEGKEKKKWIAPPEGWVKLDIDAAFQLSTGEASRGAIIRDHTGKVLLSAWALNQRCATVEEAEAEACFEGIQLAVEWIKKPTIIESDCHYLVKALQTVGENRARYSNIVKETKDAMMMLPEVVVSKIGRVQ